MSENKPNKPSPHTVIEYEELGDSDALGRLLTRHYAITAGALQLHTEDGLVALQGMGRTRVDAIKAYMSRQGIRFRHENENLATRAKTVYGTLDDAPVAPLIQLFCANKYVVEGVIRRLRTAEVTRIGDFRKLSPATLREMAHEDGLHLILVGWLYGSGVWRG